MRSRNWIPLVLFAFFGWLYHVTRSHSFSYDGVSYALDVEFGTWRQLFHPNHLLYAFLCRQAYALAELFGYHDRAIFFMGDLNAVMGAAAVALLSQVLSESTNRTVGSLTAVLFGVSQVFWSEAIDPGCYALGGLGAVLLLVLLFDRDGSPPFRTGLLHGLMVLLHQMLILAAPAFMVAWFIEQRETRSQPYLPYLAGLALGAVLPYGIAAHVVREGTLAQQLSWVLTPSGSPPSGTILNGYWWNWNFLSNLRASWDALVESLTVMRPWGGLVVAIVLALVVAWSLQAYWRKLRAWPDVACTWTWIGALGIFQFFFFHATRYSILLMPPLLYLLAACIAEVGWRLVQAVFAVAIVFMGMTNYAQAIAPAKAWNPGLVRIYWIQTRLHPKDFLLFLGRGNSIRNVDMAYFAPAISARSIFGYLLDQYNQPKTHMEGLAARFAETWRWHGRVWVEKDLTDPHRQGEVENETHVVKGSVRNWFKRYRKGAKLVGPDGYDLVELKPPFHAK